MSGLLEKWIARVSSMHATVNGGAYTSKRVHFPGGSYLERTDWMDGVTRQKLRLKLGGHVLTLAWENA